jgi:hypothetical protein
VLSSARDLLAVRVAAYVRSWQHCASFDGIDDYQNDWLMSPLQDMYPIPDEMAQAAAERDKPALVGIMLVEMERTLGGTVATED